MCRTAPAKHTSTTEEASPWPHSAGDFDDRPHRFSGLGLLTHTFYKAAIAAGGRDNGAPGIRAHYHPNYYGAFVLDPDGHNIEAVCHTP
ncbi:hypothetical protein [Bradyrhizobium sp. AZCC 2289]|uniref:hypothetical protein n=1 Tax=Bradyrhizobium sp. AZCC 2289 TaxID=3117026 RepID=UPI003FA5448C